MFPFRLFHFSIFFGAILFRGSRERTFLLVAMAFLVLPNSK